MQTLSLPFIKKDWTITISDIPAYPDFAGVFKMTLDYHILQMIADSNNPNITPIMKQEIRDKLLANINHQTGEMSVLHHQTNGIGRFYSNDNVSIIPFSKYIKHTVFKYLGWCDIDMVKGHMTIAYEMGLSVGLSFNHIKRYIDSFSVICDEMREFYQLDEEDNYLTDDDIKWLYCIMMYGGGLKCWVEGITSGCEKSGYKPKQLKNADKYSPFAELFKNESLSIIDRIYTKNTPLVKKLRKPDEDVYDTKKRLTSYWFQIIENHVLYIVYQFLCEQKIIKPRVCGPEYDGLCLPPISSDIDKDSLICDINTIIRIKTGLKILMKFKDYSPTFVLDEIIEQRKVFVPPVYAVAIEAIDDNQSSSREYRDWKTNFEKEWCKIKNTGTFIRSYVESGKTRLVFQTKTIIQTAYEHECYFTTDQKGRSKRVAYIFEWLNDPLIRCYDDAKCVPPPLVCPKNVYNLWIPSPYESMKITPDDQDYDMEAITAFENHMKIMCNNDLDSLEYSKKWVAHSIQKPGEKMGVCITMTGEEGTGKTSFINRLGSLYGGRHKVLETTAPEDDIFGKHNELMASAYLVVLSEVDKRNFYGSAGKYKGLITDSTININPKGKTAFAMDSYHRFIVPTNEIDSIVTHKGDRRNVIIRCSDEKKGDKQYFQKLNEILDKPNAMRSIYWWFKSIDISSFKVGDIITTEYHKDIIEYNAEPVELFMRWFLENHSGIVEISSVDFLKKFDAWRGETRIRFGEHMSVLSLLKIITFKLKPPKDAFYAKKGKVSNTRIIDTEKMIAHMRLEYLTNNDDSETEEETTD